MKGLSLKRRCLAYLHLDSGARVKIRFRGDLVVSNDRFTGRLTEIKWESARHRPLYVDLDHVLAVELVRA